MQLELIKDYKSIDKYRKSFNDLAKLTFNIDFEKWFKLGFWNDSYCCYSYIDNEKVIANVSISFLNIIKGENKYTAIQIGTVMVHPEYRKRGLASKLMETVFKEYESRVDMIYLFADLDVIGFYNRYGFKEAHEVKFSFEIEIEKEQNKCVELRKMDINQPLDINLIKRISKNRIANSTEFSIGNYDSILAWHCLQIYPNDLFYIKSLDAIIIYKIEEDVIHVFDVVCEKSVDIKKIVTKISTTKVNKAILYFTPNYESQNFMVNDFIAEDYVFFYKSDEEIFEGEFFYPITAHA